MNNKERANIKKNCLLALLTSLLVKELISKLIVGFITWNFVLKIENLVFYLKLKENKEPTNIKKIVKVL